MEQCEWRPGEAEFEHFRQTNNRQLGTLPNEEGFNRLRKKEKQGQNNQGSVESMYAALLKSDVLHGVNSFKRSTLTAAVSTLDQSCRKTCFIQAQRRGSA